MAMYSGRPTRAGANCSRASRATSSRVRTSANSLSTRQSVTGASAAPPGDPAVGGQQAGRTVSGPGDSNDRDPPLDGEVAADQFVNDRRPIAAEADERIVVRQEPFAETVDALAPSVDAVAMGGQIEAGDAVSGAEELIPGPAVRLASERGLAIGAEGEQQPGLSRPGGLGRIEQPDMQCFLGARHVEINDCGGGGLGSGGRLGRQPGHQPEHAQDSGGNTGSGGKPAWGGALRGLWHVGSWEGGVRR